MSHYGYCKKCPECSGVAEYDGDTYSGKEVELYNSCKCHPKKTKDEMEYE